LHETGNIRIVLNCDLNAQTITISSTELVDKAAHSVTVHGSKKGMVPDVKNNTEQQSYRVDGQVVLASDELQCLDQIIRSLVYVFFFAQTMTPTCSKLM